MDISIYPNPSSGKLFVCGTEQGTGLAIFNNGGEAIYRSCPTGSHTVIDLGDQPEGVYFVEMRLQDKTDRRKFELVK